MRHPIIGVSSSTSHVNVYGSLIREVTALGNAMLEPIVDAGGTPVLVPNIMPLDGIEDLVSRLDGLLLPGGQDVDPQRYGQAPRVEYGDGVRGIGTPYLRPAMMAPNPRRDEIELALYREVKRQGKPILGLCRGMQLMNVAEGGTLHQEVREVATLMHELDANGYNHHHDVHVVPGSRMHALFESTICPSPSTHHQALDRVGEELRVTGTTSDGVIEFVEHVDPGRFIVGVQGDIERARVNISGFWRLYQQFVAACCG